MKKGAHLNKIYFIIVSLIVGLFLLFVCNSTKEGQKPLVDGEIPDITFEAGNVKEQVFQKVSWSLMEPFPDIFQILLDENVIDAAAYGDSIYYLMRQKDSDGSLTGYTGLYQRKSTGGEILLCRMNDRDGSYDDLDVTGYGAFWLCKVNHGMNSERVSLMCYSFQNGEMKVLRDRGTNFAAYGQNLYWYILYENGKDSLMVCDGGADFEETNPAKVNSNGNVKLFSDKVYGDGGLLEIHDGLLCYVDREKEGILRYDLQQGKMVDLLHLGSRYGVVSHLQANKDYAVWLQIREDMDGYALIVYDYKEKQLYDVADKEFPVLEENLLLYENFLMIGKPYTEVTIYNLDTHEVTVFE